MENQTPETLFPPEGQLWISKSHDFISEHVGEYIQLGWHGIQDGLKMPLYKFGLFKIGGFDKNGTLWIKAHYAHHPIPIHPRFQNQRFRIVTKRTFKNLPKFA